MKQFLFPVVAALALISCGKHEPNDRSGPALPATEVQVAKVAMQTLQLSEELTGTARAKVRAVIEAKISGRILAMDVTLGQTVKAGETLATLDAQELQARLESAKATLEQTTRDEQRIASLVATNAVSKAEYDAAKARLDVAKAGLSEAQTMLGYARITAPFDGVVTRKLADQGDLATPGKPLLDLDNPAQLQLEADIPETLIANLKLGTQIPVRASQAAVTSATVAEISPAGDPNSRTFPVKLDLPAGSPMRPGQFVRIAVPVREYEALVIPAAALVQRGQMQMVFVNDNGQARLRLVRAGRQRAEGIEVLAGLDGGESIVVSNAAKLSDGQPLTVKP